MVALEVPCLPPLPHGLSDKRLIPAWLPVDCAMTWLGHLVPPRKRLGQKTGTERNQRHGTCDSTRRCVLRGHLLACPDIISRLFQSVAANIQHSLAFRRATRRFGRAPELAEMRGVARTSHHRIAPTSNMQCPDASGIACQANLHVAPLQPDVRIASVSSCHHQVRYQRRYLRQATGSIALLLGLA